MANGDVDVLKGRDQALRVAKVLGTAPANEVTGTDVMNGDTSFDFEIANNITEEDCRGAPNMLGIIGTQGYKINVSHSALLVDAAFENLRKAAKTSEKVFLGKQMVAGLDWNGLWYVQSFKETIGLDESVKSTFSLIAAGAIELPVTPRVLATGA